jgi:cytochrome b561
LSVRNTATDFGLLAKTLHWTIAVGIWVLIYLGLQQSGMESGPERTEIRAIHGSIALVVLVLMTIRLAWRFLSPPPGHPEGMPGWQKAAASLTHWGIYALVFLQIAAGIMTVGTTGKGLPFFGLFEVPLGMARDGDAHEFWEEIHEFVWLPLSLLLVIHVAAALYNHFIAKNDVLRRMTVGTKGG